MLASPARRTAPRPYVLVTMRSAFDASVLCQITARGCPFPFQKMSAATARSNGQGHAPSLERRAQAWRGPKDPCCRRKLGCKTALLADPNVSAATRASGRCCSHREQFGNQSAHVAKLATLVPADAIKAPALISAYAWPATTELPHCRNALASGVHNVAREISVMTLRNLKLGLGLARRGDAFCRRGEICRHPLCAA